MRTATPPSSGGIAGTREAASTAGGAAPSPAIGQPLSTPPRWRRLPRAGWVRWGLVGCWVVGSVAVVPIRGVPLDRVQVLAWTVATLAVVTAASAGTVRRLLVDWVPLAGLLVAYDLTRGAVDTLGMPVQVRSIAAIERTLFAGHVPTVWLQEHAYRHTFSGPAWWEAPAALVYFSHFVVPYVVGAWFWARGPEQWRWWRRRFVGVTAVGLAIFTLIPAAPPWMASDQGVIDPVKRTVIRGWSLLGLDMAEQLLHTGQASVNQVAAMPSLHAGYAALAAALFWEGRRPITRLALASYPLVMGIVLVLTAEHYVVDVLAGWALVVAVCAVARRWERRPRPSGARSPRTLHADGPSGAVPVQSSNVQAVPFVRLSSG